MTAVELFNLSLLKIGHSKGVTTINDATREAWTIRSVYDHKLREALRSFPWPFATKYADLLLVRGRFWNTDPTELTLVQAWDAAKTYVVGDVVRSANVNYYAIAESTNQVPPNVTYWSTDEADAPFNATSGTFQEGDWLYAYRWPSDCIFARRIVPATGRQYNENPIEWRIGRDKNGLLLYTDRIEANLEYTTIDCTNLWTDDIFLDAFTWLLASTIAPSLSRDKDMGPKAFAMFLATLEKAAAVSSREGQQHRHGDAPWINARYGGDQTTQWGTR